MNIVDMTDMFNRPDRLKKHIKFTDNIVEGKGSKRNRKS